jgi:hypothetical protein
MRETSAKAFHEGEADGSISKARALVLMMLRSTGPMTGREVNAALATQSGHKRLSELRRMHAVFVAGKRTCRVTGRQAVEWAAFPADASITALVRNPTLRPSKALLRAARGFLDRVVMKDAFDRVALMPRKEGISGPLEREGVKAVAAWLGYLERSAK